MWTRITQTRDVTDVGQRCVRRPWGPSLLRFTSRRVPQPAGSPQPAGFLDPSTTQVVFPSKDISKKVLQASSGVKGVFFMGLGRKQLSGRWESW